ncbi:MAG: HD-GYP domain-containing protein [Nitrospirae bacterium]|nr:HD-GYP domain-containing protein [Nitrospirota bacterium]
MIQKIKTKNLRIGMHVILPGAWVDHSFLRSRFTIRYKDEIKRIIESGFDDISIDTSLGIPFTEAEEVSHGKEDIKPPEKWETKNVVPDELLEAVNDKNLTSEKKASIVYSSSVELMRRLLDDPKAENIKEAKGGIAEVVNLVVSDQATAKNLLRITAHDFYTYTHSVNVGVLSILLCKSLFGSSDKHDMHELGAGFFLHDMGKIRVDPAIINKPGRLTDEEMKRMRIHPYQSYKIMKEANALTDECAIIAMQHHEREDGTGYPMRLKGDEIHTYGRVGCIADVYDALTAERSYKAKLNPFDALKIMKENMINHFHKEIFDKFVLLFT